jgi:hypothetical protein
MRESTVEVVVVPDTRRVIRYKKDQVGNDLTAVLSWCETHREPVWVYDDGSYECPWTRITLNRTAEHMIVAGPWET